jgi:4-aminobutyrate aminotransferase-like enzyme
MSEDGRLTESMTAEEIVLANREHLFPAIFHYYSEPLVLSHAKNQFVYDAAGQEYLDFFGGIVTVSVGHCNDFVNGRLHAQIDKLQHTSTLFATEPQAMLARKLAGITPEGKLTKCFFTNSGTEANEAAILLARCYTGSSEIIALRHSYHGRSAMAMTANGISTWRQGNLPQAGIVHALNAYCYRCPFGLSYPDCGVRCAQDVQNVIRSCTSGRIAGLIAEPIQGVAGFVTPPKEYFPIVAEIVRNHGGIFIADEVQTAWGRTGKHWFGIEHSGVVPDVITSGKGLGNGIPIAVTVAKPEIADSLQGLTISTFGGNPIATTAGKAVLDFIEANDLRKNTAETGAYLKERLLELQEKYVLIGDVRGMGLMLALELVRDRGTKEPADTQTALLMEAAREERLLIGKGGMFGNVLRISPPMNITRSDVEEFIIRLDRAFHRVH